MYSDIEIPINNTCFECNLHFDNPHELQNHKRKFCLHSGYDNLEGLAQMQWQGTSPPHRPAFSNKQHIQKYGANSLAYNTQQHPLTSSNLNKDMRHIDRFKRQIERANKYKHSEASLSQASSQSKSHLNDTRLTHNSYSESRLDEQLKRYQKPVKEEADCSPTFIQQLNMKNHTMLDKSNSTMARMSPSDKLEYARVKLDELNQIKSLYIQNGGNKSEFKANIDKMISFYEKFLQEQNNNLRKQDNAHDLYGSQELIQSRCSTPILKLRSLDEKSEKGSKVSINTTPSPMKQAKSKVSPSNQHPQYPFPGMPYGYPPMVMMPYPPPQPSQSSDSMRLLQKMMELKSEENKQLMEIMFQERKKSNAYPSPIPQNSKVEPTVPQMGQQSFEGFKKDKKGVINVEQHYQFKKSMIEDLISQEKVLLALQQQQLDELKLLSQLPKELQELKLTSVIKSSQTRFQVQKQLLKQKMNRLAYQQENQTFEEDRKLNNDRWAGQQRKKLLQQQVDKYMDNFESHFVDE